MNMTLKEMKNWLLENGYTIWHLTNDEERYIMEQYVPSPEFLKRRGLKYVECHAVIDLHELMYDDGLKPQYIWYSVKYVTKTGKSVYELHRP